MPAVMMVISSDVVQSGNSGRMLSGASVWPIKMEAATSSDSAPLTDIKRLIAHARERSGGGAIIQISSTAGIVGFERRAVYCATKFAVIGLTKVLALDHGRDGIRVNAVLPHVVETDMFHKTASSQEVDLWRTGIPMGRLATVEDIGALVMFLCSPAASYLTGGVYPVDGGAMAGPFGGDA